MEKYRVNINNIKTNIINRYNKIISVYESIENEYQYDSFIAMCDTHLEFCKFWQDKLKPKWYNIFNKRKKDIYDEYFECAQYTLNNIQNYINSYNDALKKVVEEEEYVDSIRKRITIESKITQELQDIQYNNIRKEEHKNKIGFVTSKPKRKYTRKKKAETNE